ncbi:response regulator [Paenibacillus eucommiae]|uniref:YesN/AraC family two-component response regulator n=1 Tax=Paenibacillus eucommiae TaxID=1355755 RepID=A0ABS4J095_9BACL|nr:response regulator [Paenibacillus eucommiae]MBP1993231.1 YesN/AraC family two-component response regulator [Paenibacillus eucommiae]
MRTIVIVDDEKLVRVGLQSIMNWEQNGYEVIGVYRNGEEAWEAIQGRCPDIVLTDIRMPKMDGMALIALLKQHYAHVNVIILSSYEDFEYTRKAIQMNVKDYLVKHELEAEELVRVLNNLDYPLQKHASEPASLQIQEKQKLLLLTRQPEHKAWHNGAFLQNEIPMIAQHFNTADEQQIFFWFSFRVLPNKHADLEHEWKALSALLDEAFARFHACFIGCEAGTYVGFIQMSDQTLPVVKGEVGKITDEVLRSAKNILNMELYCGLSGAFTQLKGLPEGRSEATKALEGFFYQGKGVYWYDEASQTRSFSEAEWIGLYRQVKQILWNEQFDQLYLWIEQQSDTILPEMNIDEAIRFAQMIAQRLIDYLLERYQVDLIHQNKDFPVVYELFLQLHHANSYGELSRLLIQVLQAGQAVIRELKEKKGWIKKTCEYIEDNFNQPLRLEEIARRVNFSENYFSQRFRQETGYSFSDYLMNYRIEKAKELFLLDQLSTEEVAEQVGYANTNYFTRVFKKITGMTISDYKRRK